MSNETLWQKFHVGQRVWCKDASDLRPTRQYGDEIDPKEGEIYTIRGFGTLLGKPTVLLVEIVNPVRRYHFLGVVEPSFYLRRFEPVREQNIEIFRQMCRDAETKVSA